jgi:hypothetical protein
MRVLHLAALVLCLAPALARAEARHQLLSGSTIVKDGRTVGFRARILVDPQGLTRVHKQLGGDVRLGLGSGRYTGSRAGNDHRDAIAGVRPGYIIHQLSMREVTGPAPGDRGPPTHTLRTNGQLKEVEVEVLYADNPQLRPGAKVDLVAAFWKQYFWHPWGAADGPLHSSQDFVIELPR